LLTSPPIIPLSERDVHRYNGKLVHAIYEDEVLTRSLVLPAPYVAKPSLTSIFKTESRVQKESRMQKESWMQKESQMQKETQMQVIESIVGRIRVEDRVRVGELSLLWRRKVRERDQSTALTHAKVCLSFVYFTAP
jgi:hypothetical protein